MKKVNLLLILILATALFLRVYRVAEIPPSLSWDEASVGYDAWALTIDGKDQWGQSFPLLFRSFGEYKYPLHIYATALSVKFFGLTDFAVRFPSALLGVLNIGLLFLLLKRLTKNNTLAITASFFLAISPWHIQFSRVNWETNFALLFFLGGLNVFFYGLEKKGSLLILSFFLFGVGVYTYNAAKVFVPLFVFALVILYAKELLRKKTVAALSILLFVALMFLNILSPQLSGRVRFQQVSFSEQQIQETGTYGLFKNRRFGELELVVRQYLLHFSPQFLFISGDPNPRHSIQSVGQLYWFDLVFIPLGLLCLLKQRKRWGLMLGVWFFLAPLPASLVREAPQASRAMFALGGWQAVSALGLVFLSNLRKSARYHAVILGATAAVGACLVVLYVTAYFNIYSVKYSADWQFGYKKIFNDYRGEFNRFDKVIVSDTYGQPYIFALYNLQYSPDKFRSEVQYNPQDNWGASTVRSFGNFLFMPVTIGSLPYGRLLIFASPQEKLKEVAEKGEIKNLDGSISFYVYELKK